MHTMLCNCKDSDKRRKKSTKKLVQESTRETVYNTNKRVRVSRVLQKKKGCVMRIPNSSGGRFDQAERKYEAKKKKRQRNVAEQTIQ